MPRGEAGRGWLDSKAVPGAQVAGVGTEKAVAGAGPPARICRVQLCPVDTSSEGARAERGGHPL